MPNLSSPDIPPVQEGEILDGKYRVDRVLGVGGMGIVVAATHVHLNTRVAIKFLLPAAMGNAQVIERFAREARAAVQIQSEHVARVTDVGSLPTGSPYMVMEFLEGNDLANAIEREGAMPVERTVSYVLQACEAIAEAHALGIVHRDLKPANLFLARRAGRDPMVKVLDFGISKTNETASGLTQTSSVMGSPFYMAPEQMMSSKDVDARADIWALGVILYELLSGQPPFTGETMAEVVFQVTQRDPLPLRQRRPDVPDGLAAVVSRCLMRDPRQRYENVAKLAGALVPFGPARSEISLERISRVLGASVPPPADDTVEGKSQPMRATSSTWARPQDGPPRPPRARMVIMSLAGSAVLLIGLGVVWRAMHHGDASNGPALPAPPSAVAAVAPSAPAATTAPAEAVLVPLPDINAIGTAAAPAAPAQPASRAVAETPPPSKGAAHSPGKPKGATPVQPPSAPSASAPPPVAAAPPPPPPAPAPAPARGGLNMGMKE
jgi:eukaryotic-like serine/threonine-protein kinase